MRSSEQRRDRREQHASIWFILSQIEFAMGAAPEWNLTGLEARIVKVGLLATVLTWYGRTGGSSSGKGTKTGGE